MSVIDVRRLIIMFVRLATEKKFKKKCEAIEVKGKQFKVVWSIRDV